MTAALHLYERALRESTHTRVRFEDGTDMAVPMARYLARADSDDRTLLTGISAPVLDVGCGPGRHVQELTNLGIDALGVDISPVAVQIACRGGGRAVVADIFGEVPDAGRWATALLLDGNIGIGGRPVALLRRLATLLAPGGAVLVEVEGPQAACRTARARIESAGEASGWFPWARVSTAEIGRLATDAGMTVEARWQDNDRFFARLRCPSGA